MAARIRGSSSRTRRGVKPLDTSRRSRVASGASIARNDITLWACSFQALASRVTPIALENTSSARVAQCTSACRESTQ